MHVIQYIATKADDVDQAFRSVKDYLEGHLGSEEFPSDVWYDWFVTGGGRWSTSDDQYDDNYTADVAHQGSPKFQEYLDQAHKYKLKAVEYDLEAAREVNVAKLLDSIENNQEGLYPMFAEANKLHPFRNLYNHMIGNWGPDSYFFDIVNDCTHPRYMLQAIDNNSQDWYIVPVDFHY